MVQPRAGQGTVQIALRLPPDMRDRIRRVADENGRSLNSEIVARLEASLAEQGMTILINEDRQQDAFDKIAASIVRHIVTGGGEAGPDTKDEAMRLAEFLLAANKKASSKDGP